MVLLSWIFARYLRSYIKPLRAGYQGQSFDDCALLKQIEVAEHRILQIDEEDVGAIVLRHFYAHARVAMRGAHGSLDAAVKRAELLVTYAYLPILGDKPLSVVPALHERDRFV